MSDAIGRLTASLADHYRIERELGVGEMATVDLAHDHRFIRALHLDGVAAPAGSGIGDRFHLWRKRGCQRRSVSDVLTPRPM